VLRSRPMRSAASASWKSNASARLQQPHDTAPLGGAALLSAYKDLEAQVRTALPSLFSDVPKEDFDIRGAEWLAEPASALFYQRAGSTAAEPRCSM